MKHGDEVFGVVYERGEVVVRQGEPEDTMYIIQSGAVEVSKSHGRREIVISILGRGEFFGEMALLDAQPRSCTVTALKRTRLLPITHDSLLRRAQTDPGIVLHLLKVLSNRIQETNNILRKLIDSDEILWSALQVHRETESGTTKTKTVEDSLSRYTIHHDMPAKGISHPQKILLSFKTGEIIFNQAEHGDTMYIIIEGSVEISQDLDVGKRVLAILHNNDFFGEMAIISNSPRSAAAKAITDTILFPITHDEFFERIKAEPELALHILRVLVTRLRRTLNAIAEPQSAMDEVTQSLSPLLKKQSLISIAFVSLSSCSGCSAVFMDDQKELSEILKRAHIVYCPMLMDKDEMEEVDIALVEGVVRVKDDEERLEEARAKSRYLVAWGTCAAFGGIPAMANNYALEDLINESYGSIPDVFAYYLSGSPGVGQTTYREKGLELLRRAGKIDDFVKIDYYIPGCPPRVSILNQLVKELRGEQQIIESRQTVCGECKRKAVKATVECFWLYPPRGLEPAHCFSSRGTMCMGMMTRGGCGAACINGGLPCWGCRGPSESAFKKMNEGYSIDQILLNLLSKRSKLPEIKLKSLMSVIRSRANSSLNFYQSFFHDYSRIR